MDSYKFTSARTRINIQQTPVKKKRLIKNKNKTPKYQILMRG